MQKLFLMQGVDSDKGSARETQLFWPKIPHYFDIYLTSMSKSRHTRDGKFTVLSCSGLIQPEQYKAGERLQQQVNNRHTGKKNSHALYLDSKYLSLKIHKFI